MVWLALPDVRAFRKRPEESQGVGFLFRVLLGTFLQVLSDIGTEVFLFELHLLCTLHGLCQGFSLVLSIGADGYHTAACGDHSAFAECGAGMKDHAVFGM